MGDDSGFIPDPVEKIKEDDSGFIPDDPASQTKLEYVQNGGRPEDVYSPERLQTLINEGPEALLYEPPIMREDGSIAGPTVPTNEALKNGLIEKKAEPAVIKAMNDGVDTVSSGFDADKGVGFAIGRDKGGDVVRVEEKPDNSGFIPDQEPKIFMQDNAQGQPQGGGLRPMSEYQVEDQSTVFGDPSFAGALGRGAARSAIPTVAGIAGGAATGAALGAVLSGPLAPAGALIGGIAGGILASYGAEKLQDYALEKILSPETKTAIDKQFARDSEQQPVASFVGQVAPSFVFFRPSPSNLAKAGSFAKQVMAGQVTREALETPAVREQVSNLVNVGFGAGTQAGLEAYNQVQNGNFEPLRIGASLVLGALQTEPTALGRRTITQPAEGIGESIRSRKQSQDGKESGQQTNNESQDSVISQDKANNAVKTDNLDSEYDQAVKSGNLEKAQSMVDNAARAAGYDTTSYRGDFYRGITDYSKQDGRPVESPRIFTTPDKARADAYDIDGKSRKFYINKGKSLDASRATELYGKGGDFKNAVDEVFNEQDLGGRIREDGKPYTRQDFLADIDSGKAWNIEGNQSALAWKSLISKIAAKGYDSVSLRDSESSGGGISMIMFRPQNMKISDPATYDNRGNLIPLSQRFSQESNDIRGNPFPSKKRDVATTEPQAESAQQDIGQQETIKEKAPQLESERPIIDKKMQDQPQEDRYDRDARLFKNWEDAINEDGLKYLKGSDSSNNKNWEKEGGIKIDNGFYNTIVSGDTSIATSDSDIYLYKGKVSKSSDIARDKNNDPIVTIEQIVTKGDKRGSGSASKALSKITSIADRTGTTIQLEPTVIDPLAKKGKKALTKQQLVDWYKRNGFVQKYEGSDQILIREPKKQAPQERKDQDIISGNMEEGYRRYSDSGYPAFDRGFLGPDGVDISKFGLRREYVKTKNDQWSNESFVSKDGKTRIILEPNPIYYDKRDEVVRYSPYYMAQGEKAKSVTIEAIYTDPSARGTGLAREAIKSLKSLSDETGINLLLYPTRIGKSSKFAEMLGASEGSLKSGLPDEQLVAWYKRNGFSEVEDGNQNILIYKPKKPTPESPAAQERVTSQEPTVNNKAKMPLKDFEELLKNHDWYYEMADDSYSIAKGAKELQLIKDVILSGGDQYKKLYDQYRPNEVESIFDRDARMRQIKPPPSEPPPPTTPKLPFPDLPEPQPNPLPKIPIGARLKAYLDNFRRIFQDKFVDIENLQKAIASGKTKISDIINIKQDEELYHGRVGERLTEFNDGQVKPLLEELGKTGVSIEVFERYSTAKHAKERNAVIAERNPSKPDGGSGMTNAEADKVLNVEIPKDVKDKIEPVRQKLLEINRGTLKNLLDSGLISPELHDLLTKRYKDYVPLRGSGREGIEGGTEYEGARITGTGSGLDVRGRDIVTAKGRGSKASDLIAYSISQHIDSIVRSEKNAVLKTIFRFALAYPHNGVIENIRPSEVMKTITYSEDGVTKYAKVVDERLANAPDIVAFKENGVSKYIRINDPRLADIIKNRSNPITGNILDRLGYVMRYFAIINTQASPEFTISNFARDLQEALININSDQAKGLAVSLIKNIRPAIQATFRAEFGKADITQRMDSFYNDFRKAGGRMTFFGMKDFQALQKQIQSSLGKSGSSVAMGVFRKALEVVEKANSAVENATRLATFATLRENGFSVKQSAYAARNITINFTKKGTASTLMNSLYLFFNANVQGTTRMIQALATSKKVQKIAGAAIVGGFFRSLMNRIIGGEDETGLPNYDRIPEYRRAHSFIIMNPFADTESPFKYISFPTPYGYSFFDYTGQLIADSMPRELFGGGQSPTKSGVKLLTAALDSFNPLGGGASLLQVITPTLAQPITDITMNRDYAGRPIMPDPNPFDQVKPPKSQVYWSNVAPWSKWMAEKMNEFSGGNRVRSGFLDVSPEVLEYVYEFATGAVGKFVERVLNAPIRISKVTSGEMDSSDIIGEVPMGRKILGSIPSFVDVKRYQDMRTEILTIEKELKDAAQNKETQRVIEIKRYANSELSMAPVIRRTEQSLKELRKQRRKLQEIYENTNNQAVLTRINDNKRRQKELMIRALKIYNSRIDEKK